jgi:hypothetical protein
MDKWHRERIKASNKDKILKVIAEHGNINYNDIITYLNKQERNPLVHATIKAMCKEIVEESIAFPLITIENWGTQREDTINANTELEKFLEEGGYSSQLNAQIADEERKEKIMTRTYYITLITLGLTILFYIIDKIIG